MVRFRIPAFFRSLSVSFSLYYALGICNIISELGEKNRIQETRFNCAAPVLNVFQHVFGRVFYLQFVDIFIYL